MSVATFAFLLPEHVIIGMESKSVILSLQSDGRNSRSKSADIFLRTSDILLILELKA
jgi:hypothetical protein